MKAHLKDTVKSACIKSSATLAVIPGGLTKKIQPLDLTVNKCFKEEIRRNWENWMTSGLHDYTKSGHMKRASYSEVSKWVDNAWKSIKKKTIISGFRKAEILQETDISDSSDDGSDSAAENDGENELDEQLLRLFHSDSEESEFEGFDD